MPSNIPALRQRAFNRQDGKCCYCTSPMWLRSPYELPFSAPSGRAAKHLQCTAEHLVARSAGGKDAAANIAAACARCNYGRHKRRIPLEPSAFRNHVLVRMGMGRWHARWVHTAVLGHVFSPPESNLSSRLCDGVRRFERPPAALGGTERALR